MTTDNLGDRLKKIRESKGFTQEELARLAGKTKDYISRIERSSAQNITTSTLESIAKALGVHSRTLLFGEELNPAFSGSFKKGAEDILSSKLPEGMSDYFVEIPLIKGSVSAGDFRRDFDEYTGEYIQVPKQFISSKIKKIVAIKVKGSSMAPTYHDGDFIFIQREADPYSGAHVIAALDGDITFKEYKKTNEGKIELRPLNPEYSIIPFKKGMEILGVVVGAWRNQK